MLIFVKIVNYSNITHRKSFIDNFARIINYDIYNKYYIYRNKILLNITLNCKKYSIM